MRATLGLLRLAKNVHTGDSIGELDTDPAEAELLAIGLGGLFAGFVDECRHHS